MRGDSDTRKGTNVERFEEFFRDAIGYPPYGYQARLARDGLPAVVQAPTGAGKTGVILAWLWRRLHGPDPAAIPRRLIYALQKRSLVEQVAREAERWLENLGLTAKVALRVVMGGEGKTQQQWRLDMHQLDAHTGRRRGSASTAEAGMVGIGYRRPS